MEYVTYFLLLILLRSQIILYHKMSIISLNVPYLKEIIFFKKRRN